MEFDIPFVNESIDISNPKQAAVTSVAVVGGFAVFYLASFAGREVSNTALDATGLNDDGVEVL